MRGTKQLKPDTVLKDYWKDNERFADLFNSMVFGKTGYIKPEFLTDADTQEAYTLADNKHMATVTRTRDVIKSYSDEADLILMGVENQMNIHYAMPVRSMLYDGLRYMGQCKEKEKLHRKQKDYTGTDEFLSGYKIRDKIKPIFTLVIYYGEEPWNGPSTLHDMMNISDSLKPFINDYRLKLVQAKDFQNISFANADNRILFDMLNMFYGCGGKLDMNKVKEKYPKLEIWWETLAAIGAATGTGELVNEAMKNRGGRIGMCKALENLMEESKQQGIEKGLSEGERKMAKLTKVLLDEEKYDELKRAAADEEYRRALFEEYGI